jgi:hypothetical protein
MGLFPICELHPLIKPHANVIMNVNINIHRSHGVKGKRFFLCLLLQRWKDITLYKWA